MAKKEAVVRVDDLKKHVGRAVMRVPDVNPKTGEVYAHEIAFTFRPGWSNVGRYERALPGGKIKKEDFSGIVDTEAFLEPNYVLTLEQMILAGLTAAEREVLEELNYTFAPGVLAFSDISRNREGWTTYTYAADLAEKPEVPVKTNSAGTAWMDQEYILNHRPKMLSGHLGMARRAIKFLDAQSRSK